MSSRDAEQGETHANPTPRKLGYYLSAEWDPLEDPWLQWPHDGG
jgi:agmatine/peptidylarginine deiminase